MLLKQSLGIKSSKAQLAGEFPALQLQKVEYVVAVDLCDAVVFSPLELRVRVVDRMDANVFRDQKGVVAILKPAPVDEAVADERIEPEPVDKIIPFPAPRSPGCHEVGMVRGVNLRYHCCAQPHQFPHHFQHVRYV